MKRGAFFALCLVTIFAAANAQLFEDFPFCQCKQTPSPYRVSPVTKDYGNGTYCFTIIVKPLMGCKDPCCKADLKKMEFNARSECRVGSARITATVNGVPIKAKPFFDSPQQGPNDSMLLKLTQLGLGLDSNGTEICMTLGTSRPGQGCTTLEELCLPPAGGAPGSCSIALFDSKNDCCPLTDIPAKPASSPPPPFTPAGRGPCTICAYLVLEPTVPGPRFPWSFDNDTCYGWSEYVAEQVAEQAERAGVAMDGQPAKITCGKNDIQVCGTFVSADAAATLQPWFDEAVQEWLAALSFGLGDGCPAWLYGYTSHVLVGGELPPGGNPLLPPPSCINASAAIPCIPNLPDFPACECNTDARITPFAVSPVAFPAGTGMSNKTDLYCFTTSLVEPINPNTPCGKSTSLLKAEFYANDQLRRKVRSIFVQPAKSGDAYTTLAPTWGSLGENTLKATPLRWSKEQADGAVICIELDKSTSLAELCMANSDTCWINLFDDSKKCCPLYPATAFS